MTFGRQRRGACRTMALPSIRTRGGPCPRSARSAASGSSRTSSATWPPSISPPYDVISPADQQRLLARDPRNVVRLDLPPDELGDGPDDRYRRAARTFAAWRSDGSFRKDPRPSLYVYEQTYRLPGTDLERTQRGFFGRLAARAVRAGQRGAAPRADDVRAEGGPLQAAPGDRCELQPDRRALRRPDRRRGDGPRRGRAAVSRRSTSSTTTASTIASGSSRATGRRARPATAPSSGSSLRRRPIRSRSPTGITATRPRCAIATSAG